MKKNKKIFKRLLTVCFLFTLTIFGGAWSKKNNEDFDTIISDHDNIRYTLYGYSLFTLYDYFPELFVSTPNGTGGYEIKIDLSSSLMVDPDPSISRYFVSNTTISQTATEYPLNCVYANATWGGNDGICSYQGKIHLFVGSCDDFDISVYISNLQNSYSDIQFWYVGQSLSSGDFGHLSFQSGYERGMADGFGQGYTQGAIDTEIIAYDNGYSDGSSDSGDFNLISLFTAVVSWPYNFFREVLNFDLLGINLWAILTSLITLGVVVFVVRKLWGGK